MTRRPTADYVLHPTTADDCTTVCSAPTPTRARLPTSRSSIRLDDTLQYQRWYLESTRLSQHWDLHTGTCTLGPAHWDHGPRCSHLDVRVLLCTELTPPPPPTSTPPGPRTFTSTNVRTKYRAPTLTSEALEHSALYKYISRSAVCRWYHCSTLQ